MVDENILAGLEPQIVKAIMGRAQNGDLKAAKWLEERGFMKELRATPPLPEKPDLVERYRIK